MASGGATLIELIESRLRDSVPPADPVAAAVATLPDKTAAAWFTRPLVPAAVLVTLIEQPGGLNLLLTQRTDHLPDHPGQISFPGGRVEAGDRSAAATALREAHEEIALPPDAVTVLGYLPTQAVVTGFAVTPVVGWAPAGLPLTRCDFEVAEFFEVPLDFFLDEANCLRTVRNVRGIEFPTLEYRYQHRRIWGATAHMLDQLITLIKT